MKMKTSKYFSLNWRYMFQQSKFMLILFSHSQLFKLAYVCLNVKCCFITWEIVSIQDKVLLVDRGQECESLNIQTENR